VAQTAELALTRLMAMGFRRPLDDGGEGGDGRVDLYLRELQNADGNAGTDRCSDDTCVGYAIAENDFAGFAYPSVTEGIRSVVPHELFHLIQLAYASGQTAAWAEGSAVWAVEELYGDGNADFERFLPAFLPRSFRPLERTGGGFGDGYPYGAALWPYFLARRFDPGLIVEAWAASSAATPFLDAIGVALARRGSSLEAAFTEMTRWNLFTGGRAAGGGYPGASRWPEVPAEPELAQGGKIYVEGLSARYLDVTIVGERQELRVTPGAGLKVAGWVVPAGGGFAEGVALEPDRGAPTVVSKVLEPGTYTLVVTGLTRNSITTAVQVEVAAAPPVFADDTDGDGGGCQAARSSTGGALAAPVIVALGALGGWRRRRRAGR
jgi:hypothetical protein